MAQGAAEAATAGREVITPENTETEKANRLFLERVQNLPGVIRVERCGGQPSGEPSIRVHVRRNDLKTEYAVYDLKGEVYRRHPEASLRVDVWLEDPAEAATPAAPGTAAA
jgi:hypothetical protein